VVLGSAAAAVTVTVLVLQAVVGIAAQGGSYRQEQGGEAPKQEETPRGKSSKQRTDPWTHI